MGLSSEPTVELDRTTDWPAVLASLREYWEEKRGDRAMPSRDDISSTQLIKSHLPHMLLVDVVESFGGEDAH